MATYLYRAIDENSMIFTGKASAKDDGELDRKLTVQGLTLIEAEKAGLLDRVKLKRDEVRFSQQDLLNFSFFLHLIITSGIPLMNGLQDLVENKGKKKMSRAGERLYAELDAGKSLSAAMQENPSLFPHYYVQMIKAGESSGNLDRVLEDLMAYVEWQINFRKVTRSALVYPCVVLGAVVSLIVLLITFVFPRLVNVLVGLRVELPLPTRIIISIAGLFQNYFIGIIVSCVAGYLLLKVYLSTDSGRRRFDALLLSLPLIGELVRKINLSRYFKALVTLYTSGLNMEQTFTIASGVVQNAVMRDALALVTESVMTGEGIAQAMQKSRVFPSLILDMVSVGEKTGNLENVALRASNIFDKEVPESLKKIFTYLEPFIIVLLGVVVMIVLLSVFLPIYKAVGGVRVR